MSEEQEESTTWHPGDEPEVQSVTISKKMEPVYDPLEFLYDDIGDFDLDSGWFLKTLFVICVVVFAPFKYTWKFLKWCYKGIRGWAFGSDACID